MHPLQSYPFLSEIQYDLILTIDLDVLHHPSISERRLLEELSQKINKNLVIYKKEHISSGEHLCRVLEFASLTSLQLNTLKEIEKLMGEELVVVAYNKPLSISKDYRNIT